MLQVSFIMISIIHKISVLLKITIISKWYLQSIIDFLKKIINFFTAYIDGKFKKIIKDVRNFFRLEKIKKEDTDTTTKGIRNLFKLEKKNEEIKDRIIRDIRKPFRLEKENKAIKYRIRNLFEYEGEENYHKPVRFGNFWSNNYTEHKSDSDWNKTLSVKEYLNKVRPYLKDIINNIKKCNTGKTQLTIKNNFVSPKVDDDEERVIHSKSDNIKTVINDEAEREL